MFIKSIFGVCPDCSKFFAMKIKDKKLIRTEDTNVIKPLTRPHPKGELHIKSEQLVPARQYVYELVKKCRFCGNEKTKIVYKTKKVI